MSPEAEEETTMTRDQRNEFNYYRRLVRELEKDHSQTAMINIPVSHCAELKQKVTDMLTAIGYWPCKVGIPSIAAMDSEPRIIFIWYGSEEAWQYATFQSERETICKAINA